MCPRSWPERDCLKSSAWICYRNIPASEASQLTALAVSDPLWRQRWIPSISWGQYADRRWNGLHQQAERDDQQRKACAGSMDVGLEPGFICHVASVALLRVSCRIESRIATTTVAFPLHTSERPQHHPPPSTASLIANFNGRLRFASEGFFTGRPY